MTTVTKDALGAKAAAEAGRMRTGIFFGQKVFRKMLEWEDKMVGNDGQADLRGGCVEWL